MRHARESGKGSLDGVVIVVICWDAANEVLTGCDCQQKSVNIKSVAFCCTSTGTQGWVVLENQIVTVAAYCPCITLRTVLSMVFATAVVMIMVFYSSLHGKSCACILLRMRHDRRPTRTR